MTMKIRMRFWKVLLWGAGICVVVLYLLPSPYVRDSNEAAALTAPAWWKTQFVEVEPGVALEVLDFGGTGRPIVLLAGLGGLAHSYRAFAPKLIPYYHVYAVTRRGFGNSTWPRSGYSTRRLGEDIEVVINTLRLERPLLVGHSFAGAEMSSLAARYPEKACGLVYLDAGYDYALYDTVSQHHSISIVDVSKVVLPFLPRIFQGVSFKILAGAERFNEIPGRVLAIYAFPHDLRGAFASDPTGLKKAEARDYAETGAQIDAFARQVPHAKIVRIPQGSHMIFRSNEIDVLREIRGFADALPL
jgi:non-heme chloroperoxidase